MYNQANDNELLYLIKEGNPAAYRTLYKKYEHLIYKLYKENIEVRGVMLHDFMQESFMCLEKAIYTYQDSYKCSFYSYFLMVLRRNNTKLFRKNGLNLKEQNMEYRKEAFFNSKPKKSSLIHIVERELDLKTDLEKDLFYECILNATSVSKIAKKYGLKYTSVYLKYKKIKQKIENILTNALV